MEMYTNDMVAIFATGETQPMINNINDERIKI